MKAPVAAARKAPRAPGMKRQAFVAGLVMMKEGGEFSALPRKGAAKNTQQGEEAKA